MTALNITDADIGEKLRGKSAIVTGGSFGIGLGIVQYLTKCGVRVLNGDIKDPSEEVKGVLFQKTDAVSWEDQLALFKKGVELFGRIDIVVPNAGFRDRGDYLDYKDSIGNLLKPEFACLKVTLIGQMYTVKLAMHNMRNQYPQGSVIVSTVKAFLNHTPTWNVRINLIAPHVTDTALLRSVPNLIPGLIRFGILVSTVEETARATAFLAAIEDYNGSTISIMGSEYRELEIGVERHKRDVMGNDPRFNMTPEQKEVIKNIFAPVSK
ncbi:hypothetical protein COCCADRAFT_913 [Bipolaris zeicola 26-R-13]|uniref:Uncharacterized protein n=1 Tax=Cochliobolus carbonum (strain 26-R-13) TaxID=930089 RepID=W6YLI1_COCC2|nr:uncharacterized protein COCCADRAFT_913 [Bipolaris zeicola 26-R-13]EUC38368.1 hypothetical protein COCCADRAFT_913 [Bipolaris zeicola 26-R-13]